MPLTDTAVRNARPSAGTRKLFDGGGMYLEVSPGGGKWWRLKYRFAGKEKRLSLGVYPEIRLAEARARRDDARRLLARDIDPSEQRKADRAARVERAGNTFETIAIEWIEHQGGKWEPITKARALASLENDIFPAIGKRPIAEIGPREVAATIKAIEKRGAGEAAARALQRVRAVFRFAAAHERIEINPMTEIKPGELLKARHVTHRPALSLKELPGFLSRLKVYEGDPHTVNALRLLMLTAVRPGELRGARWDEIDTEGAQWRIPAARMKMRAEHIVPLSKQALEVIEAMRPFSGARELIFPSPFYPLHSLSENTFNSALARMGYKGTATAHGFRSLFSTVANECGWDASVIERQLAHIDRNPVRAAYNRAQYLDERAKLMQWWADFIQAQGAGGKVVAGSFRRAA